MGRVVSGYRVKILDPHPTHQTVGSGRVGRVWVFSCNFRVMSGLFLGSGKN
jgi:hypothetical protein